jgi:type IV secretory pathway VirB2 component (pilin)
MGMKFQVNKRAVGRGVMLLGLGLAMVALSVEPALASSSGSSGSGTDFGTMLTNLVNFLNGTPARMLGALAVMGVGIAWMFGHIDLRRAGSVVAGLALVFGASTIVGMLTGSSGS